MSSYTVQEAVIIVSENPSVYLTPTTLVVKGETYQVANIRGCRVEEVASFSETDLFYANEAGPGKVAFRGLKWALGLVGTLNIFQKFSGDTDTASTQSASTLDADPPLYCLALATGDDEIQLLPSINRRLLLDLADRLNRELGLAPESKAA